MHKTKTVKYKGHLIQVDVKIIPLLQKMWKLGIGTTNSCQAQCSFGCKHKTKILPIKNGKKLYQKIKTKQCDSFIWIAFESCRDLEKLYNYVAEYSQDEHSTYALMGADQCFTENSPKWHTPNDWGCIVLMRNHGVKSHIENNRWMEDGCGKNHFVMEPQITFPIKDLNYVHKRLDVAIAKLK